MVYIDQAGRMYFHRKTVFDCIGLESLVLGNKKGFLPLNAILTDLGLDFSQVRKKIRILFSKMYFLQIKLNQIKISGIFNQPFTSVFWCVWISFTGAYSPPTLLKIIFMLIFIR